MFIAWNGTSNNCKLCCCSFFNGNSFSRCWKCFWFYIPLIAVHLFVFYFGLMADVTPPVGLASYAAAAISGGDPLKQVYRLSGTV